MDLKNINDKIDSYHSKNSLNLPPDPFLNTLNYMQEEYRNESRKAHRLAVATLIVALGSLAVGIAALFLHV